MTKDLIRDSALGATVRLLTGNRVWQHHEDLPGFSLDYQKSTVSTEHSLHDAQSLREQKALPDESQYAIPVAEDVVNNHAGTDDQPILVGWYGDDDPANPQNWTKAKKVFISTQICIYTFAIYIGSAIYTPGIEQIVEVFGVSVTVSSLGLALYVLGYGCGPLLFSPLSEVPAVGRNPPYIVSLVIFLILCVPTALAPNLPGLLVLRYLQGFFGSPCLATGGATFNDMFDIFQLPFLMAFWMAAGTAGPALGPIIAGYTIETKSWRWPLWEMMWIVAPVSILLFVCLPETSADNILLRRAARIRSLTGNPRYRSESELRQKDIHVASVVREALWRPIQIIAMDPAVTFVFVYTSLIYALYYSFFESFPLIYVGVYHFTLGQLGLAFLSIPIAMFVQLPIYLLYLRWQASKLRARGFGAQEERLLPALLGCFLPPVGLFLFAWTTKADIHWIVGLIGVTIFNMGFFLVFQCIFIYLPLTYAQYTASLMAGNGLGRSVLSFAAILFSRPLFDHLGVARGVTILASLTVACVGGMWALWYWGAKLRARSRFTVS